MDSIRLANEVRSVVGRLRRRLIEIAGDDSLSPSQTSVLSRLDKAGDSTAGELAKADRVRPQSMSVTLASLARQGLIRRDADLVDGRRQVISLSDAGRKRLEGGRQARTEWLAKALDERFTESERRTVAEALALMDRLNTP